MKVTKQAMVTAEFNIPDEYCTFEYMLEDEEFCRMVERKLQLIYGCESIKVEPVDNANKL